MMLGRDVAARMFVSGVTLARPIPSMSACSIAKAALSALSPGSIPWRTIRCSGKMPASRMFRIRLFFSFLWPYSDESARAAVGAVLAARAEESLSNAWGS